MTSEAFDYDDLIGDLGLSLGSARGRPPKSAGAQILEARPLTAEDVARRASADRSPGVSAVVKSLRARHHSLAVLLSQGVPEQQCAIQTGYSASRISILKNDPAFKNLLEYYATQQDVFNVEVQERMKSLNLDAIEVLSERLEENPDQFENTELIALVEKLSDRTGNGKTSTVKVEHGLEASVLDRLKRIQESEQRGKVLNLATEDAKTEAQVRGVRAGEYEDAEILDASYEGEGSGETQNYKPSKADIRAFSSNVSALPTGEHSGE